MMINSLHNDKIMKVFCKCEDIWPILLMRKLLGNSALLSRAGPLGTGVTRTQAGEVTGLPGSVVTADGDHHCPVRVTEIVVNPSGYDQVIR